MTDAFARLKAANGDFERRDAALRQELKEVRDHARVTPEGRPVAESVEISGERIPYEQFAQETIVRRTGRPVLAVIRNQARLVFEDPDSRIWKERLERASAALARAASAIGRIEVKGHQLAWLGTGWLVAPDIIVTNRHVALEFGRQRGAEFVFRQGISGATMIASIDFLEELERQDSFSFELSQILHIEDDEGPDLAFLRVRAGGNQSLAAPIALSAASPQPDEAVAVIGYPARDSRIPDVDLMDRIYGDKYDKKRLAPGQIMRAGRQQLQHDCTTLGGNSGSAVISLGSGEAVGVHFAGTFLTANYAVPSTVVLERLEQVSRPGRRPNPASRLKTDQRIDTPAPQVQSASTGSTASVSFNLPLRVSVDIGAPVAAGSGGPALPSSSADGEDHDEDQAAVAQTAVAEPRAQRIAWSADLFSTALSDALTRHDFKAADRLITVFEQHAATGSYPYAALYANRDLAVLRKKRQFLLMRRYAAAAIATGVENMRVHRQYGQALIELGEFQVARDILAALVKRGDVNRAEEFEALGLIGRSYKQEYVDDPTAPEAADLLRRAIESYQDVYGRDQSMVWHGINVASCTMRAHRDEMQWADASRATQVAQAVLDEIKKLEEKAEEKQRPLDVWDYATKVEALVILNRLPEAEASLEAYLAHPDMDAFEVSSTHRQLTQVLRLDASSTIMRRLSEAVDRFRGGGALRQTTAAPKQDPSVSVLIRLSDPNWQPPNLPDLIVHSQAGAIVSVEGSRESLRQLLKDPLVQSFEESRPGGTRECRVSLPLVNVNVKAEYAGPSGVIYTERGNKALIAVIDDGIDIHHQAFLGADGKSRIVGIWDQTKTDPTKTRTPPPGFIYGTYYDADAIAAAIAAKSDLGIGRNDEGHGTHVASIAAGRACGDNDADFGGGVAPEACLLVVITDNTASIGYSRPHLDALVFIDAEATRRGLPVVVNVSQGMNAGAHDGKSPLEASFNTFCSAKRGRVVVKSAGNEGDQAGHARFTVGQDGTKTLKWRRPQGAMWRSEYIELWWRYGNELEFQLGSPSGAWSDTVTRARQKVEKVFGGNSGTRCSLALVPSHPEHGDAMLRIDLESDKQIESGVWQLKVVGRKVKQEATIHAWIERGDPMPSRFEVPFQTPDVTLSIPGTADYVITVGAILPRTPYEVAPFSSLGRTRDGREKPDIVAPGVGIKAARGGTPAGVTTKEGTSMAAPHVTGAVALVLSRGNKAGIIPTAAQIAVALRQNTLNYTSHWSDSEGYGVLDVTALLAAFHELDVTAS